jgi:hypothetical protein
MSPRFGVPRCYLHNGSVIATKMRIINRRNREGASGVRRPRVRTSHSESDIPSLLWD